MSGEESYTPFGAQIVDGVITIPIFEQVPSHLHDHKRYFRNYNLKTQTFMDNNLIPFDLEAAKAGAKLITRNGQLVTDFKHFDNLKEKQTIYAVINNEVFAYYSNGRYYKDEATDLDLFMAPIEKKVWINEYIDKDGIAYYGASSSAEIAFNAADKLRNAYVFIKTHEITLNN